MWTAVVLLVAGMLGTALALLIARRSPPPEAPLPWALIDMARLHVIVMGGLGGFAMTGLLITVALARTDARMASGLLDAAVFMLVVAVIFFVCNAFLLSYLPTADATGTAAPRLHFALCSTIEFRTIFLSLAAVVPLLQAHGLTGGARILTLAIPALLLFNVLIVAMVAVASEWCVLVKPTQRQR